ncbi:MAG: S8 family serine peptidase [Natronomonas sp.]
MRYTLAIVAVFLAVGGLLVVAPVAAERGAHDAVANETVSQTPATPDAGDEPTGEGVTIAILDSGINDDHPDLDGRVVDRVDLTDAGADRSPETGVDTYGHGTHAAGVAAGSGAASDGAYAGVAPGADLVDVRVMESGGDGDGERIVDGITYAVAEADADVVLLSLRNVGAHDEAIAERVEWAADRGVVVVASAGNTGRQGSRSIGTPGTTPAAITVGAAANGSVTPFSAAGPTLDGRFKPELLAPGEAVVGPASSAGDRENPSGESAYVRLSGTSFAAAQVAGAAAVLLESDPESGPAEIEARLTSTAEPIDGADAYRGGSGVLDVERAIDPDIVADAGALDVGVLTDDRTVTRTITFENHGEDHHELSFDLSVRNVDRGTDADGTVALNRSELSIPPGETASVELVVDGDTESGAHAGTIEYEVDGSARSVAVSFFRGGVVTVEKRPLSDGDRVDGNELLVFTESGTHDETLEFEDGTASFLAGGGRYVLWSSGVDEPTRSLVLLSERIEVDGPTRVVLDEADTRPVGVDVDPIAERYGPLLNHSVTASMSTPVADDAERLSRALRNTEVRTVRASVDPETRVTTTKLLATEGDHPRRLDGSDVFQVSHTQRATRWASPAVIDPEELTTREYRIHRTTRDRSPEIQPRTTVRGAWNDRPLYWFDLGSRSTQRIHGDGAIHEHHVRGGNWRAMLPSDGGAVLRHPLVARSDLSIGDGRFDLDAHPLADGAGTRLRTTGEHVTSVTVDGEVVAERRSGDETHGLRDIPVADGESVTVTVEGKNPDGRLSTATLTEVRIDRYGSGADVPEIHGIEIDGTDRHNAVDPGRVSVAIDADDRLAVDEPAVWYTEDDIDTPPWVDDEGWQRAPAGHGVEHTSASLQVSESAKTVSLAVELSTDDGHVRTMTTDAVHVGSAPDTTTRSIDGRLWAPDGTPAANDTVVVSPVDADTTTIVRTDESGAFEAEVPKDETYDVAYRRGNPWRIDGDGDRPVFHALDRVTATADTTIETRLPAGTPLDVGVFDERGQPVSGATVQLRHRSDEAASSLEFGTGSDGRLAVTETASGIALSGTVDIVVEPPSESAYADRQYERTVDIGASRATESFVVETVAPEAAVSAEGGWLEAGSRTTLDAGDASVPAGAVEYRWDLDGDGEIDRVTDDPTVRYTPSAGVSRPTVTVVDSAGKTDTDSTTVRVLRPRWPSD